MEKRAEMGRFGELFRDGSLEGTEDRGKSVRWWFGEEEMDVLGHDDVAEEFEQVVKSGGLQECSKMQAARGVERYGLRPSQLKVMK